MIEFFVRWVILVIALVIILLTIALIVMSGRCSREEEKWIYEREARVQGRDTDSN